MEGRKEGRDKDGRKERTRMRRKERKDRKRIRRKEKEG
jgi:hypothetical protein